MLYLLLVLAAQTEREALLVFLRGLHSTVNDFSSWLGKDCCKWNRVGCDNATGHVVSLDLSFSQLYERIPDQLGNLSRLQTLDLSGNEFQYSTIPEFIGSFKELKYLDLSFSHFFRKIPDQLGNLSRLQALDLSGNEFQYSTIPEFIGSFKELNYLDLSFSHFFRKIPDQLGNLSKLHTLDLNGNELNELGESFSGCIRNSLQELNLSANSLSGDIPDWIGGLKSLKILDLSRNSLSGSVLDSLGRLSSLQHLDISYNCLNGTVSESLGQLNELVSLTLNNNFLVGVLTEHHFANLTRLKSVDLSGNSLVLNMSSNWVPPFQLDYISTSSCTLGPRFPSWLLTQETLTSLKLSFAGISDSIPNWFWNSNTSSFGLIPRTEDIPLQILDLSSNKLSGVIPRNFGNLSIWGFDSSLPTIMNLSRNGLSGSIPEELTNLTGLAVLDLSKNNLIGALLELILQQPLGKNSSQRL
ncbi:uncharacterized protein [Typha latifolia]|uniref:uncharacterized protein n=1 Tax=Typha latifolia TaxID=4733 RepID=UPI003C2E7C5C